MIPYEDFQQLCKEGTKGAAQWFESHAAEIREDILGNVIAVISDGKYAEPSGQRATYCSAVQDSYSKDSPLRLSDIIYCCGRYEKQSCHKIIFGNHKKVVLPGHLEIMMTELESIPFDKLQSMISFMEKNYLSTSNPDAILQMRFTELADRAGEDMVEFLPRKTRNSYNVISRFAQSTPSPKASVRHFTFQSSDNALYIILFLCARYDLSADYLLMQDYSEIAYFSGGGDLNELQQLFLSAYLNAAKSAQEEIIRQMGYARLGIRISLPDA